MHADLDAMDANFFTPSGKGILAGIHSNLPAYEQAYHDLYSRLRAKDMPGTMAALKATAPLGDTLGALAEQAIQQKVKRGKTSFEENKAAYSSARALILFGSALCAALGMFLAVFIAKGFAVPLGQTETALEQLADGDMTASLDIRTTDEVGRMGAAFNRAVERLNATLQEVSENASQATMSSQQLASAAESIASGAQEQAASLEETSASLEEITATVRQSADNAHQASQLASGSRDSAEKGQEVVTAAVTAMTEINAASAKISDIIGTIDEIAFQTNLLAVNAAVEAARAGEEGRGFAVVATEVRSLAQRSAGAAKEIKGLIQDSLKKVETGSVLVNKSGETLLGIVGSVKRVTDIVGEIAASAAEQSTGVEQVNTAVTQMDQVTQSNSAQTEELSATAQALSEQAQRLRDMVGTFILRSSNGSQNGRLGASRGAAATRGPVPEAMPSLAKNVDLGQSRKPRNGGSNGTRNGNGGRSSKPKVVRQPVTALATTIQTAGASSSAASDSFEEF